MDVNKKIERLEAWITIIAARMEDQQRKDRLRLSKDQEKREALLRSLRSVCPHKKTAESGEFVGCESGLRYERWRTCLQCGLRLS